MRDNKQGFPSGSRVTVDGFGGTSATSRRSHYYVRRDERRLATGQRLSALEHGAPLTGPVQRRPLQTDIGPRPHAMQPPRPKAPSIDMGLPGVESKPRRHPTFRRRVKLVRRRVFQATALALAIIIGGWSLVFVQGLLSAHQAFRGGATAVALQQNVNPNQLKGEGEGRINVLLLGIGGEGHDGPDLTDTMMIASIDPVNHKTVLVSVPRDTWVKVPHHGSMKINAAFAMGKYDQLGKFDGSSSDAKAINAGFNVVDQTVQKVLGITIHYNMLLNFQAFRQAVDAVNGITVNVPTTLYDPTMAWENHRNPVLAKAGVQQFDGKQALLYVRSRETSSDFARSQRQRSVMLALKQKVAELGTLSNPLKISGLLSSFGKNVVTDLSLKDASQLYGITKKIPAASVLSVGLGDVQQHLVTTGRVGNQSIVLPLAGMYDYTAIQQYVRQQLPDGYIVKEHTRIVVENGTTESKLAQTKADELKNYGYNVTTVKDAPTKDFAHTVLVDLTGGKKPYTAHYLERRFGISMTTTSPDSAVQTGTADFILIIGSDETTD
jgi:LCP family protein required for cell wall assembly